MTKSLTLALIGSFFLLSCSRNNFTSEEKSTSHKGLTESEKLTILRHNVLIKEIKEKGIEDAGFSLLTIEKAVEQKILVTKEDANNFSNHYLYQKGNDTILVISKDFLLSLQTSNKQIESKALNTLSEYSFHVNSEDCLCSNSTYTPSDGFFDDKCDVVSYGTIKLTGTPYNGYVITYTGGGGTVGSRMSLHGILTIIDIPSGEANHLKSAASEAPDNWVGATF